MAISLSELMALRSSKAFQRIEALVEQREKAQKAIVEAQAQIDAAEAELQSIGIVLEAPASKDAARSPRRTTRGPRAEREPTGKNRATSEYQDALDQIGHMLNEEGKGDVKGPDIVKAMRARGFASKQGIMMQLKKNPRWSMTGEKRAARYQYHPNGAPRTRKSKG